MSWSNSGPVAHLMDDVRGTKHKLIFHTSSLTPTVFGQNTHDDARPHLDNVLFWSLHENHSVGCFFRPTRVNKNMERFLLPAFTTTERPRLVHDNAQFISGGMLANRRSSPLLVDPSSTRNRSLSVNPDAASNVQVRGTSRAIEIMRLLLKSPRKSPFSPRLPPHPTPLSPSHIAHLTLTHTSLTPLTFSHILTLLTCTPQIHSSHSVHLTSHYPYSVHLSHSPLALKFHVLTEPIFFTCCIQRHYSRGGAAKMAVAVAYEGANEVEGPRTLYEKIWRDHLVHASEEISLIYVDRHLVHEVTSPQAFEGLRLGEPQSPSARLYSCDGGPQHPHARPQGLQGCEDLYRRRGLPNSGHGSGGERGRVRVEVLWLG